MQSINAANAIKTFSNRASADLDAIKEAAMIISNEVAIEIINKWEYDASADDVRTWLYTQEIKPSDTIKTIAANWVSDEQTIRYELAEVADAAINSKNEDLYDEDFRDRTPSPYDMTTSEAIAYLANIDFPLHDTREAAIEIVAEAIFDDLERNAIYAELCDVYEWVADLTILKNDTISLLSGVYQLENE